jgi:hypothetical protein
MPPGLPERTIGIKRFTEKEMGLIPETVIGFHKSEYGVGITSQPVILSLPGVEIDRRLPMRLRRPAIPRRKQQLGQYQVALSQVNLVPQLAARVKEARADLHGLGVVTRDLEVLKFV